VTPTGASRKNAQSRTVKLDIASRFEMLEMVQTVLAHISSMLGFEDDAAYNVSVAVRESVVNAIKHGNQHDESKRVAVVFTIHPAALEVKVQDQGLGFDPETVPNPIAEENLLKSYGRGIFFMRNFMDEVTIARRPEGGMAVHMVKKLS
jgi:serine/threonine-protein kinase RsbW